MKKSIVPNRTAVAFRFGNKFCFPDDETIKQLHRKAMNLTQDAIVATEKGQDMEALGFYLEAFEYESKAAMILKDQVENEPTRSIIIISAVNLALECGLIRDAEKLVTLGLSGDPKEREAEELRNLYENINLLASGRPHNQNRTMIAIFCRYYDDFQELELYPKNMFVRVKSVQDIRGVNFTGVIQFKGWYGADSAIIDAFYDLKDRQPELFL